MHGQVPREQNHADNTDREAERLPEDHYCYAIAFEKQDEQRASAVLACLAEGPAQASTAYTEQTQPLLRPSPLVVTECRHTASPTHREQIAGKHSWPPHWWTTS